MLSMNNATEAEPGESMFSVLLERLEAVSKVTGIIAALVAILAVLLPSVIWRPIESVIASIYGSNGWVYYEVGENRAITSDGNFYLLKETETGYYDEINIGDKLRVSGDVNFRTGPGSNHPRSFVLINGDCVIVTSNPKNKIEVETAQSGGWLEVATSPCGLF